MCHSFTDKMAEEKTLLIEARRGTCGDSIQALASGIEQVGGRSGNKRAASDTLEQNVTKAAKLAKDTDDDVKSEIDLQEEPDPRDEKITRLRAANQKHKARIAQLEQELDDVDDKLSQETTRRHELEAREAKRIEKENVVETNMHASMKLAHKNMTTQMRTDQQKKEKDMKERYNEKLDKQIEKNNIMWEKKYDELQDKHTNSNAKHKQEKKDINDKHAQEKREMVSKHKEELKSYRPEYSLAIKEKNNELKAKDKKIAELEKVTESMDAVIAEKEDQANKYEKAKRKINELRQANNTIHEGKKEQADQYNHKLEHEARRWKIQNDIAEDAKIKLMTQQRSIFALRAEANSKHNQILALQHQLQATQHPTQIATSDATVQSNDPALDTLFQTVSTANNINPTNSEDEMRRL